MPERFEIDWGVSEALRDFGTLRDTLGSSGGTTGALSMLGGGAGISDIRGAAEALHRATLSGLGQVTAARYGLPYRPFEIGEATDRGAMLIQALEGLRETARTQGRGVALADARNLNLEDWVGVLNLTAEQFEKIKQDALVMQAIYTPERAAAAFMLNHELSRLQLAFNDITITLGSMVIPHITALAESLAGLLRPFGGGASGARTNTAQTRLGTSMDGLRAAVEQNTNTLRMTQGFYGGGMRARNALPPAFGIGTGQEIQRNLRSLSKALGSISFNF